MAGRVDMGGIIVMVAVEEQHQGHRENDDMVSLLTSISLWWYRTIKESHCFDHSNPD